LNADPIDGDSNPGTIDQLLNFKGINSEVTKGRLIPSSNGGKAHNQKEGDKGAPAFDTSFFGKRVDYVLPSKDLETVASGIFWPTEGESLFEQVKNKNASDHLLIWVDVFVGSQN
jgi:Endonuclease/Exonuclease/phosphatase family